MPSEFVSIRFAYEEALKTGRDMHLFEKELFLGLLSGRIAAECEQVDRSTLIVTRYNDAQEVAAGLKKLNNINLSPIKLQGGNGLRHYLKKNGYVTVDRVLGKFEVLTDKLTISNPGGKISPLAWQSAYYDKSEEKVVSIDGYNDFRSVFYNVIVNQRDLIEMGLIRYNGEKIAKVGRNNIYDNISCNAEFLIWYKNNPQATRKMKVSKLREIYSAASLPLADDKRRNRAEFRAIENIIAPKAAGPK